MQMSNRKSLVIVLSWNLSVFQLFCIGVKEGTYCSCLPLEATAVSKSTKTLVFLPVKKKIEPFWHWRNFSGDIFFSNITVKLFLLQSNSMYYTSVSISFQYNVADIEDCQKTKQGVKPMFGRAKVEWWVHSAWHWLQLALTNSHSITFNTNEQLLMWEGLALQVCWATLSSLVKCSQVWFVIARILCHS